MEITRKQVQNLINLEEITKDHIVVFIADKKPHVFSISSFDVDWDRDLYTPICLAFGGAPAAEYIFCEYSLKAAIEYIEDFPIQVFESKDWKKALTWLIENAE